MLYSTLSTFLYFEQARIVAEHLGDADERTRLFAFMDLAVNVLTVLAQLFVAARVTQHAGVAVSLALVPLLVAVGFFVLGVWALPATLVVFQIVRRAGNYAIARPAREMLFSVLSAEDRYKSKSFIDTVTYRGGDAASGWAFALLKGAGLSPAAIAFIAVPIAVIWGVTGYLLGRSYERRSEQLPVDRRSMDRR